MEDRYHTSIHGSGRITNRRHLEFYSYEIPKGQELTSYEANSSIKSSIERKADAEKALDNFNDRDLIIAKYATRNIGESDISYNNRLSLFKDFLSKGIGPSRSENLSNILLNKLVLNVVYPEYTQDIVNIALEKIALE